MPAKNIFTMFSLELRGFWNDSHIQSILSFEIPGIT